MLNVSGTPPSVEGGLGGAHLGVPNVLVACAEILHFVQDDTHRGSAFRAQTPDQCSRIEIYRTQVRPRIG
jgi:hypothetical protein